MRFITAWVNCNVYELPTKQINAQKYRGENSCVVSDNTRVEWNSQQLYMQDGDETTQQQTVGFTDLSSPEMIMENHNREEVATAAAMSEVDLKDFLRRPVKIGTVSWLESDPVSTNSINFDVWRLFFSDASIQRKLYNWAFLRCDLKLRILFNASPFYYGAGMFTYIPLGTTHPVFLHDTAGTTLGNIPRSQTPLRSLVFPQDPKVIEVTLPFFNHFSFLRTGTNARFTNMGNLQWSILDDLKSANGVTGTGINISIYAWAENVELSGPTIGPLLQDDEYGMDGPISRPASAIAGIAAKLGSVPIIGKFATATSYGATAVAQIAKLFGFTNVPVIENQLGFQQRPLPPVASTEIGYPIDKLTLDSKNELTIDHRSVGLGPLDELPISHIAQRESYLTSFTWQSSGAQDDLLWVSAVTPMLYNASNETQAYLYMSPMCWLGTMFQYWRGDIIFRFKVCCSKYHQGRLRFSFDPDGASGTNISNTATSSSVVMTQVVDISEETDVEMRIPYQQYVAWCSTRTAHELTYGTRPYGPSGWFHTPSKTNGMIAARIFNSLTAPVASSNVTVLVFVRAAEDFDLAGPTSAGFERLTPTIIQDGELSDDSTQVAQKVHIGQVSGPIDHLYLTYMGEQVVSLRVLMRRMCHIWTITPDTEITYLMRTLTMNRLPPNCGYQTTAISVAKGLITTATSYPFNWTSGNFINYISNAFVGNRGSVNWAANIDIGAASNTKDVRVTRAPLAATQGLSISGMPQNNLTFSQSSRFSMANFSTTGVGASISNPLTSGGLTWQVPMYSQVKFLSNKARSENDIAIDGFYSNWQMQWLTDGTEGKTVYHERVALHAGAGTDYDCLYFLHVPTYGNMSTYPAAG